VTLNAVTFSDKNRQQIAVPLTGVREKALPTPTPVTPRKAQSSTTAPRPRRTPVTTGTTLQATVVPGAKEFIEQDVVPVVQARPNRSTRHARTSAPSSRPTPWRRLALFADVHAREPRRPRAAGAARAASPAQAWKRRSTAARTTTTSRSWTRSRGPNRDAARRSPGVGEQLRDLLDRQAHGSAEARQAPELHRELLPARVEAADEGQGSDPAHPRRRPLQGPKSFLKKRSIPTVARDRARARAGQLQPSHAGAAQARRDGQVDHGARRPDGAKQLGVAKFVRAGAVAPEGWQRYHDSFGTVYAPPFVKVKEAFDARLMEKLHEFATSLGITTVRKVKIAQKGSGDRRRRVGLRHRQPRRHQRQDRDSSSPGRRRCSSTRSGTSSTGSTDSGTRSSASSTTSSSTRASGTRRKASCATSRICGSKGKERKAVISFVCAEEGREDREPRPRVHLQSRAREGGRPERLLGALQPGEGHAGTEPADRPAENQVARARHQHGGCSASTAP
jgi:hypothetical protein